MKPKLCGDGKHTQPLGNTVASFPFHKNNLCINENQSNQITEKQHNLILGSILGDAHLQCRKNKQFVTYRLRFSHGVKRKKYVFWKWQQLRTLCKTTQAPYLESRRDGKQAYCFYTAWSGQFKYYHDTFYKQNGKGGYVKYIPQNINGLLFSFLSLAVFYMDDGTARDYKACRLSTQGFTRGENLLLIECLHANYGIYAKLDTYYSQQRQCTYHNISIPSRGYERFRECVKPVIAFSVPEMLYKVP